MPYPITCHFSSSAKSPSSPFSPKATGYDSSQQHDYMPFMNEQNLSIIDYSNEDTCEKMLLDESEALYNKMIQDLTNKTINDTASNSESPSSLSHTKLCTIINNFQCFPKIVKYFRYYWLEMEYNAGPPPYTTLLAWLSKVQIQNNSIRFVQISKTKKRTQKDNKKENVDTFIQYKIYWSIYNGEVWKLGFGILKFMFPKE